VVVGDGGSEVFVVVECVHAAQGDRQFGQGEC
jgi:hypothetical protein